MKLPNPFSDETRALFMYEVACWICGRNQSLELNHIFGRVSASPLNASVLCRECHEHIGHSRDEEWRLLNHCIFFLSQQGYKLTAEDEAFLQNIGERLLGFELSPPLRCIP